MQKLRIVFIVGRFCFVSEQVLFWMTAVFSMGFFAVVLASILLRAAGFPIDASIELSRLSFVWSCFLAVAITYRRRAHVGFAFLYERLPHRWKARCTLLIQTLILLFMVLVLEQSLLVVFRLWPTRLPMLGISQAWLYLPLSVSSVFMILFTLESIGSAWSDADTTTPALRGVAG